jgi:hypothetical protein
MTSLLWTFQNRVTQLQPNLLLALAGVTIAAGLFVWLGGLGFKKIMYVVAGIFFGAFCSLFSSSANPFLAAAIIGICAITALKLQDTFFILVASAAAAVIGYSILVRPYFRPSSNILAVIRQITIGVPYYNWPILLAVTALPFAVISWVGASALLSSAAGAVLMLAGVTMILLNNGFAAIGHMNSRPEQYYLMIALAVISGTFIQLGVLPRISNRFSAAARTAKAKVKKVKAKKGDIESAGKSTTWRTA